MKEVKPALELEVIPVRSSNAERWEVEVVVVVEEEEAEADMLLLLLLLLLLFCWTNSEIFLKSGVEDGKAKLRSWPWWIVLLLLGFWVCDRVGGVMTRSERSFLLVELLLLWLLLGVEQEAEDLLFFLEPPPTGMFLRVPPSVQYLLQVLQKYLGCVRL